jgi:hypothetical protein
MEKNTHPILLPSHAVAQNQDLKMKEAEPSRLVIENILNYSRALKVKKGRHGKGFIEYIAN